MLITWPLVVYPLCWPSSALRIERKITGWAVDLGKPSFLEFNKKKKERRTARRLQREWIPSDFHKIAFKVHFLLQFGCGSECWSQQKSLFKIHVHYHFCTQPIEWMARGCVQMRDNGKGIEMEWWRGMGNRHKMRKLNVFFRDSEIFSSSGMFVPIQDVRRFFFNSCVFLPFFTWIVTKVPHISELRLLFFSFINMASYVLQHL